MSLIKFSYDSNFYQSSSEKCKMVSSRMAEGTNIAFKQYPKTCGSLHRLESPPRPSSGGIHENTASMPPSKPSTQKPSTSFLSKKQLSSVNFSKMTKFLPAENCRLSLLYRPNDELLLGEITEDSWLKSSLRCHGLLPLDGLKK